MIQVPAIPSSLKMLLTLAAVVVIIAGLMAAEAIILPILVAIFLAVICLPPVVWLQRHGFPDWAAVLLVFLAVFAIFVALSGIIVTSVASIQSDMVPVDASSQVDGTQENQSRFQVQLEERLQPAMIWLKGHGVDATSVGIEDFFDSSRLSTYISNGLSALTLILSNTFLVLLTVVFVLFEAATFPRKLRAMVGDPAGDVTWAHDVLGDLRTYLAVKTQCSLMVSVSVTIMLWIVGVDAPVLWGLIAFMLNYIPTLGSIIAAIPPVLLAYIQFDWGWALVVAGGYIAFNFVVGNMLEPRMMGRRLGLSTLVVFLSMVFWGWVWGPVGMVLSVPLTMLVKILLEHTDDLKWVAVLLGSASEESTTTE